MDMVRYMGNAILKPRDPKKSTPYPSFHYKVMDYLPNASDPFGHLSQSSLTARPSRPVRPTMTLAW